jgi:ABC-2 type transport system permease protein
MAGGSTGTGTRAIEAQLNDLSGLPTEDAANGGEEPAAEGPADHVPHTSDRGSKPTRVVAAQVGLWRHFEEIWRSRELLIFLVRKEIKVKYMNSFLGFLWSMLNPALTLAVFYVLFTFFLPNGVPNFVIYMFSALLVWNLFQSGVLSGTSSVVTNAGIVKKVAFPREILPLASVGSAATFFVFQSFVLLAFMVGFWHRPDWSAIWILVPALLAAITFAAALAVLLGGVNVYMRDTQHLVEVLLLAWFWAIPAIYAFSGRVHNGLEKHTLFGIPHTHLIWLYFLNPVTPVVMSFQRVFYNVTDPVSTVPTTLSSGKKVFEHVPVLAHYGIHWYALADLAVFGASAVLLLIAMRVFGRLEGNFAEEM